MERKTVNVAFKDADIALWKEYSKSRTEANRKRLFDAMSGVLNAQVNKWSGPVPRDVLMNEAKILAAKAFDTYNPNAGASLATHVTNSLLPLSRIVYTYQNTARMPENLTMRLSTFNSAVEDFKANNGRDPSLDELHQSLGWPMSEISRIRSYDRRNLVESGPSVSGTFHSSNDDDDEMLLGTIHMSLLPDEKRLFECVTGYGTGHGPMSNPEIVRELGITQSQLSYKKTLLMKKVESMMKGQGRLG